MMHRTLRRVFVGTAVGIITAGFVLAIVSSASAGSRDSVTVSALGGAVRLIIASVFIGGSYAFLFRPLPGRYVENLATGLVVGVASWIVLSLNVFPVLSRGRPMWPAGAAAQAFPQLMADLLLGGGTGLLFGVTYELLAERLGLAEPETRPDTTTRVVILGGGYAGVSAAETLERELGHDPHVGIWLISQTNYLLHTPMLSEVSASAVNPQNISPPLRSFFRRVQVVQGAIEQVDLAQHTVHLASDARTPHRELPFDHLVLTVGSVPNFFGNDEIAAQAFTFKSLEDAMILRNQVIDLFERADFEEDAEKRRRMLTFVVAGGGFAGVELIGGLNDFARGILPYYPNIPPEEVQLILVHSRDRILPELTEGLANYAQEKLEQRGVAFRLGSRVTGASPGAVMVGDERIPTDTLIWTAGNKPSPVLETLGLPLDRGRIAVNTELAVPDAPGLWAAGDCALVPDPNTGGFAPPTAQHALREGKVLGYNVAATIRGKPLKTFNFKTLGSLAALGYQLAVAEILGYRFSGFFAWLMWRMIYLSKLPTLEKQVRVLLDWILDVFFPADIVQTIDLSRPDVTQRLHERVTMMGQKIDDETDTHVSAA